MKNEEKFEEIVGEKLEDHVKIEHHTVNYMDDSSNVIAGESKEAVNRYIQQFYKLLFAYYSINMLRINGDKTTILEMKNKYARNNKTDISFSTEKDEEVKTSDQIKVLGW